MMAAARLPSASGAGESFLRFSMAFSAMPLLGPSFAGRSNSTVSTSALVRCAAICAPITPAPSTAALRMRRADLASVESGRSESVRVESFIGFSVVRMRNERRAAGGRGLPAAENSGCAQAGGGEADQVLGRLFAMDDFADIALALD